VGAHQRGSAVRGLDVVLEIGRWGGPTSPRLTVVSRAGVCLNDTDSWGKGSGGGDYSAADKDGTCLQSAVQT